MKKMYIVCFSGGHSSAIAAIEVVRKYGKGNVILLNHDLSPEVEHADIKRFKNEVAEYLEIPITFENHPQWETLTPIRACLQKKAFSPRHANGALCTSVLKTQPFLKYLKENFPSTAYAPREDVSLVYGYDVNEVTRINKRVGVLLSLGYQMEAPLLWNERTIFNTEEIGIDRPLTYKIWKHANCMGCLKSGMASWYLTFIMHPEIFEEAVQAEETLGHSIIKGHFLKELVPKYELMKEKKICPTELIHPKTFWAKVRKILNEKESNIPCDCGI